MSFEVETIICDSHVESLTEYAELEHTQELKKLGGGCYARVFGTDGSPVVVKIFRATDMGYLSYLKTVCELGATRYTPRVMRIMHYRYSDEYHEENEGFVGHGPGYTYHECFVVYMERLRPGFPDGQYGTPRSKRHDRYCKKLYDLVIDARFDTLDWSKLRAPHRDLIATLLLAMQEGMKRDQSLVFDLHSGNIMWRKGCPVVTDPLC